MNHQLAQAIVTTFRETEVEPNYRRLARFNYRAWEGTYAWLDASGLALYFFDRVRSLGLEVALPEQVLIRLGENVADNCQRTASNLKEFMKINGQFQAAGISYANLKGFTLIPEVGADAALRCQLDLDFLVAVDDLERCKKILEREHYIMAGAGNNVREFIAGGEQLPSTRDLYKVRSQKSVEIHFANPTDDSNPPQDRRLLEKEWREWCGLKLPILSECDRFIDLALHLFKHLNGEWTRVSWILEYSSFINYHRDNEGLWLKVQEHMLKNSDMKVAVGAVTLLACQSVNVAYLPEVLACAIVDLPRAVRLWIESYGDSVLFAIFPGTKLYILLREALGSGGDTPSAPRYRQLLPCHRPSKVAAWAGNRTVCLRLKQTLAEISYFFFRLRFHFAQGFHYMLEASRWKRTIASLQS